jgi:Tol biopolymer transport system component
LIWYDRSGKDLGMVGGPGDYGGLEMSPDGKHAAVNVLDPAARTRDIWLVDLARGLRTRFTFDPADEFDSIWSPDGARIVFNSRAKGPIDLYEKPSNSAGSERSILASPPQKIPNSWSSDGKFLLATLLMPSSDVWMMPMTGEGKPSAFLDTPFNESSARFSSDGRWVAYTSNESGRLEIYVTPFPTKNGKWQVSTGGGGFPRWRRDGRELFYIAPDGKLMAAAISGHESAFDVGAVKPLFDVSRAQQRRGYPYDVSSDGQRFLVNVVGEESSIEPLTLLINWPAALRR